MRVEFSQSKNTRKMNVSEAKARIVLTCLEFSIEDRLSGEALGTEVANRCIIALRACNTNSSFWGRIAYALKPFHEANELFLRTKFDDIYEMLEEVLEFACECDSNISWSVVGT